LSGLAEGVHTFAVTATDAATNTSTASVTFTVDTTAPVITVPGDITTAATSESGAVVDFSVTASDTVDGDVSSGVLCDYVSGDTFPIGDTVVSCNITDAAGNTASDHFKITVTDATAALDSISAVRTDATADDTYANGWEWTFHFTLPFAETNFAMKFSDFSDGTHTIPVAGNMQYYTSQASGAADETHAVTITAADTYPDAVTLDGDAGTGTEGRQVDVTVQMKIPADAIGGTYSASYGASSTDPHHAPPPLILD
jgi:hypothetical protein